MNRYILLTKILLKNNRSIITDKKKRLKMIALWIVIAAAFAPTIGIIIESISAAYDILSKMDQSGLILAIGISFSSIFIFFFGIFYSLNVLYFTKDIENLLPLPLKPSEIIGAKFTVALFYEYLTELVLLLPILITFGIKSSASIIYYIYGIIIFLTLPLIPLGTASLLNIIIMGFTNVGKHKDRLRIINGIVVMFLAVGFNLFMQRLGISSNNPEQIIKMISSGNNSLLQISNKLFPGSNIISKTLVFSNTSVGFYNLLLYFMVTMIIVIVLIAIGEKLYFRGVVGISESFSKRKELTNNQLYKNSTRRSHITSLVIRELRILFRTPVYFMNCILMNFLWPVFILIPMIANPKLLEELQRLSIFFKNPSIIGIVIGGSLAIGIFLGASNTIASTSISREGQNIFISKYLPSSFSTQLISKIVASSIMGAVSIVVMLIFGFFLLKLPFYLMILSLFSSIPGILFSSGAGLLIDLNYPKLNWDNEVKAVKQNFNSFLGLLVGVLGSAIVGFVMYKFINNPLYISLVLTFVFTVIDYILYKITITIGSNIFDKIEV